MTNEMPMSGRQYEYAQAVLDKMWEEAVEGEDGLVRWSGSLTQLINMVAPQAHEGKVSKILQAKGQMTDGYPVEGAIMREHRGGGPSPSVHILQRRSLTEFDDGQRIEITEPDYFHQSPSAQNRQGINALSARVSALEGQMAQVVGQLERVVGLLEITQEIVRRLSGMPEFPEIPPDLRELLKLIDAENGIATEVETEDEGPGRLIEELMQPQEDEEEDGDT